MGKPLTTGFPFSLVPSMRIEDLDGYDHCGSDEAKWAAYGGSELQPAQRLLYGYEQPQSWSYRIQQDLPKDDELCCRKDQAETTSSECGDISEAVVDHPSAIAFELNEPMSIWRGIMYDTWRAAAEAINAVIPDMSVSIQDTAEEL